MRVEVNLKVSVFAVHFMTLRGGKKYQEVVGGTKPRCLQWKKPRYLATYRGGLSLVTCRHGTYLLPAYLCTVPTYLDT